MFRVCFELNVKLKDMFQELLVLNPIRNLNLWPVPTALEAPVDRQEQHRAKLATRPKKQQMKKPAANTKVMKKPGARASAMKKPSARAVVEVEGSECDEVARTQHYSPASKKDKQEQQETPKTTRKATSKAKAKAKSKAKVKASPPKSAAKATKGEEKRKRQDHTKEDTKTPPSKRSRASPKSTGSGKKTFARRFQPNKDPSKTFWAALKDAFERKVQSRVESPSKLEDHSCSKTP